MTVGQRGSILCYLQTQTAGESSRHLPDGELLKRFVGQCDVLSQDAFTALVRRHGPMVLGLCRRLLGNAHDAEDVFQATFFVLARKAASLRRPTSVAGWLYRTASHLALRARTAAGRRRRHEGQVRAAAPAEPVAEITLREWQQALDDALARLPERYRAPILLCCLGGATRDEAAQQLGWPLQTLKSRLEQGRELLRKYLARRGVELGAALAAVTLVGDAAAALAPALLDTTGRSALLFAAGQTATALLPGRAVVLAEGIMKGPLTTRPMIAAALLLAGALAVPAALLSRGVETPGPAAPPERIARATAPAPAPRKAADFGPEIKGLRARVTLAKARFVAGEPINVKYVVKNVSKAEQVIWHCGFWPNHLILVRDAGGKEPPLTAEGQLRRKAFSPGGERFKNSPVKVPAGGEDRAYEAYDLTKFYDLSRPGRYTVQYVYEEKQGGWEGRLPSNVAAFEVIPGKGTRKDGLAESQAVRVNGVDFQAVVQGKVTAPAHGGPQAVDLGLRITNRSDKDLLFDLGRSVRIALRCDNGQAVELHGRHGPRLGPPVKVEKGEEKIIYRGAQLEWRQGGQAALRLSGGDALGPVWWFNGLAPGKYVLSFKYFNAKQKDAGRPLWVGEAATKEVAFEILPPARDRDPTKGERLGAAESKAVQVNGAEFRAVVESPMRVPAVGNVWLVGESWPGALGLRVRNASDKPLVFYNIARFRVTLPDGTPVPVSSGSDRARVAQPFTIQPGKDLFFPSNAFLEWTPDGTRLRLNGQDDTGWFWTCDLKPGRYLLIAEYDSQTLPRPPKPGWEGKVETKAVSFEVLEGDAGLKQSKAVRVNGVEFQAVAEPKLASPLPGGRQSIVIGLRITNAGDKTLLFNLYDTLGPVLRSADGKVVTRAAHVRKRTAPAPPVIAGPGKAETILRRARLEWLPDGKTLRLTGPDGSGGAWYFEGLVPGKYLLSFEYENTEATLAQFLRARPTPLGPGQSFWVGKVTTNEVAVEITVPEKEG